MALNSEDKHDVKTHMGKALANKISKVTRDSGAGHNRRAQKLRDADPVGFANRQRRLRSENDMKSGNYVKLKPSSVRNEGIGKAQTTAFSPHRPNKYRGKYPGQPELEQTPIKYTKNY